MLVAAWSLVNESLRRRRALEPTGRTLVAGTSVLQYDVEAEFKSLGHVTISLWCIAEHEILVYGMPHSIGLKCPILPK